MKRIMEFLVFCFVVFICFILWIRSHKHIDFTNNKQSGAWSGNTKNQEILLKCAEGNCRISFYDKKEKNTKIIKFNKVYKDVNVFKTIDNNVEIRILDKGNISLSLKGVVDSVELRRIYQ